MTRALMVLVLFAGCRGETADRSGSESGGGGDTGTPASERDADRDGVTADHDCDDLDPRIGATRDWYADVDGDGWGDGEATIPDGPCEAPSGTVAHPGDCGPDDPAVYPGAPDECGNGIDESCSGADQACPPARLTWADASETWEGESGEVYGFVLDVRADLTGDGAVDVMAGLVDAAGDSWVLVHSVSDLDGGARPAPAAAVGLGDDSFPEVWSGPLGLGPDGGTDGLGVVSLGGEPAWVVQGPLSGVLSSADADAWFPCLADSCFQAQPFGHDLAGPPAVGILLHDGSSVDLLLFDATASGELQAEDAVARVEGGVHWVMRSADLNGDGLRDLIASGADTVYVFGATLEGDVTTDAADTSFTVDEAVSVGSTPGDFDGDGHEDLAVYAFDGDEEAWTTAWIFAGGTSGPHETDDAVGVLTVPSDDTMAGVEAGGDLDGDGTTDLWVAVADDLYEPSHSRVHGFAGPMQGDQRLGHAAWRLDGERDSEFGVWLGLGEDIDGDALPDVVASAGGRDDGAVYLFSGADLLSAR